MELSLSVLEARGVRLSTKTRYGLRILVQIALENRCGNRLARGRTIAEKQGITEPYLEQIMIPLKRAGMVGAVRGCNGGYELRRPPSEITVLDLIELFDGPIDFADCLRGESKCSRLADCPTRGVWESLSLRLRGAASAITLESIVDDYQEKSSDNYVI
jgi:Rrf2 family protein